jgi:hypothetical protein
MDIAAMTVKYRFRIRTRQGLLVNKLVIQARTPEDAERKLRQMYPHCEIIESSIRGPVVPRMLVLGGEPSVFPTK